MDGAPHGIEVPSGRCLGPLERGAVDLKVGTTGLDIATTALQVHDVDDRGEAIIRNQLRRGQVLGFFEKLPPCLAGVETARQRIAGPGSYRPRGIESV